MRIHEISEAPEEGRLLLIILKGDGGPDRRAVVGKYDCFSGFYLVNVVSMNKFDPVLIESVVIGWGYIDEIEFK